MTQIDTLIKQSNELNLSKIIPEYNQPTQPMGLKEQFLNRRNKKQLRNMVEDLTNQKKNYPKNKLINTLMKFSYRTLINNLKT